MVKLHIKMFYIIIDNVTDKKYQVITFFIGVKINPARKTGRT